MLKIICNNSELEFVREMIYDVISKYRLSLENNQYFEFLISDLTIEIEKEAPEYTSNGVCDSRNILDKRIRLNINVNDSKCYIAYVIGHEFSHLLMSNIFDGYYLGGKANDGSTNLTAVTRVLPENQRYGETLEELIADYLGNYIVQKLKYPIDERYKLFLKRKEFEFKIVEDLQAPFGESIYNHRYIDSEYYDEYCEEKQVNVFWNSILAFSFNNVVDAFDSVFSVGSFKEFCDFLDEYRKDNSIEVKQKIEEYLRFFVNEE